jgi:hypothetical protein
MSFPAVLAAVAARGPRCARCAAWTMDPDQTGYAEPMCDACATELEDDPARDRSVPVGPKARRPRPPSPAPDSRRRYRARPGTKPCGRCTRWRCLKCGWVRNRAWKDEEQVCSACGSLFGTRSPAHHTPGSGHDIRHNTTESKSWRN